MPQTLIKAGAASSQYWRDLWDYRELLYTLSWRELMVRYKQTAAGVMWAILQPLLTMVILTVVFSRIARLPAEAGVPYPLLVLSAMLPWQFFSSSVNAGGQSLLNSSQLVSKVYFPRLLLPFGAMLTALIDTLVAGIVLIPVLLWYQQWPTLHLLALPGLVVLAFLVAAGPVLLLAAFSVRFRDVRYVVPFLIQIGLYASPVGFSSTIVPESIRWLYSLNPMVGVIDLARWIILGGRTALAFPHLLTSVGVSMVLFVVGLIYFRRAEQTFADII